MASFLIHKYQIIKSVSENCYEDMEYRIWLKMYFLQSNIQLNRRVVSDDHGERFHQYIIKMEKKLPRQVEPQHIGELLWMPLSDILDAMYTRMSIFFFYFWQAPVLWCACMVLSK